jgi:ABC-type ATPase with predicted acetyltransferase domain
MVTERCVTIEKSVRTAVRPSPRVLATASMFGLGVDERRRQVIIPPCEIPLPAGGIVFVTGPSGGGKSTVLHLIAQRCAEHDWPVIRFDDPAPLAEVPLVDALPVGGDDPARANALLALVGLGDAFVMLRSPSQLSDGQRYRLRLAQTIEIAEHARDGGGAPLVLADEFGATLDRLTAKNIARSFRRWTRRTGCTFICATTHDDLLETLEPDVLVYKGLGDEIEVVRR